MTDPKIEVVADHAAVEPKPSSAAPQSSRAAIEGGLIEDAVSMPPVICMGLPAGDAEAARAFFASIPPDTGGVYIVFAGGDASAQTPAATLQRWSPMAVRAVSGAIVPEGSTIYLVGPGERIVVSGREIRAVPIAECVGRTAIDVFLESLASRPAHRDGVVLFKGTEGGAAVRAFKNAGGAIFAEQRESGSVGGQTAGIAVSGPLDAAGTPSTIAGLVASFVTTGRTVCGEDDARDDVGTDLPPILEAVRQHLRIDLSYLRPSMLRRRIGRRMTMHGLTRLADYTERLAADPVETRALYQDTLIGVTGFFRDPESFRQLQKDLATDLLRHPPDEQYRVWVPACSTGEEVYTIAMIIVETLEANGLKRDVKIFATDMDEESLARGGEGEYPSRHASDIGADRVKRFFAIVGETIVAKPILREMVTFAQHNLVKDPPFTRIDLVSCRNFLIYTRVGAQEMVLGALHFSLRRNGTLFLGSTESLGRLEPAFETIDAKHRIFRKGRRSGLSSAQASPRVREMPAPPRGHPVAKDRDASNRQILEVLGERDARTAAVLTTDGALTDIIVDPLHVFQLPKGKPTSDVVRLVIEPLTAAVAAGIQRLRRADAEPEYAVEVSLKPGQQVTARMIKVPPAGGSEERILFLVEAARASSAESTREGSAAAPGVSVEMRDLHSELMQTRETLQTTIEELQSATEEQQSTNEELVVSQEELQSTNEELQSVSEELAAVNIEFQSKIHDLAILGSDLSNLLRSINIGILFLDNELRIRKFTSAVEQIIKLVEGDVGRPIEQFSSAIWPEFIQDVKRVAATGETIERDARSARGNWLQVRILPYVTQSASTRGVVATFFDITPIKNAHEMTRVVNEQLGHANRGLVDQRSELEEMFSIVAHDLKRPVLALHGLLSLVNASAAGDASNLDLLRRSVEECGRMRRMLLDLEAISGIQHRDIVVEAIAVQQWLDELVDRFRPAADRVGARINCTCDGGDVRFARTFLEEVLSNLVENAIKYGCTGAGPRIDIACRIGGDHLELSVADNGMGIPPESHQKIFEPFRRLSPEIASGSGIGLMAVRRLVTRMGGTIALESAVGKGAKFMVRIPILPEGQSTPGEVKCKPRALIVEDDLLDAKAVERCIRDTHIVVRAQEVAEAEEKLRQEPFDLVLLDLSLPDGHGFELVNRIRTKLKLSVPIIVITGHGEGIAPNVMSSMIGGYVSKADLTKEALMRAIFQAMAGTQLANSVPAQPS